MNGKRTTFVYDNIDGRSNSLIKENRDGYQIEYQYEIIDSYSGPFSELTGFTINDQKYYFETDENGTVTKILDSNKNEFIRYEYDQGVVKKVYEKNDQGEWIDVTNNEQSIGNLNCIRYYGYYYDKETGWYYCGRYFDPVQDCFIDGKHIEIVFTRATPNYVSQATLNLLDSCKNNKNFGKPISYKSGWYNSLSDVEILTRLIYGENGYGNRSNERTAIAWVVANRVFSNKYPNNLKEVCIANRQFTTISGNANESLHARQPDTTTDAWNEALVNACITKVCIDYNSQAYLSDLMPKPDGITNQIGFVGLAYYKTVGKQGNGCLQISFNGKYTNMSDVTVVDVAKNIVSMQVINNISSPNTRNIFYNV